MNIFEQCVPKIHFDASLQVSNLYVYPHNENPCSACFVTLTTENQKAFRCIALVKPEPMLDIHGFSQSGHLLDTLHGQSSVSCFVLMTINCAAKINILSNSCSNLRTHLRATTLVSVPQIHHSELSKTVP